MQSNKLRKLQIYNLISCLIISTIIFFIYNNIPFLNDLLGHLSVNTSFSKPSCEGEGFIFCRPPFIKFLYYFLYNFIGIDFLIFLQVFFFVLTTFLIRFELIKLKLNKWIINFIYLMILINPKILKYSFSTVEESFYIPVLLLIISLSIKFILKKNLKNLIYLNLSFSLLVLIKPAGIIFYFLAILINIFYLIKIDNKTYQKKLIFFFMIFLILISPMRIIKNWNKYVNTKNINNNYFSIQALGSLISKQKMTLKYNKEDNLSQFIDNRFIKLNNIREIKKLDTIQNLHLECVIYPAMNNPIYKDPDVLDFFKKNYSKNLDKKLFVLYLKNLIKNPNHFLLKFNQCFLGNFLMVSILSEREFKDIKQISMNSIFNNNDKSIISSLERNVKDYSNVIGQVRAISVSIFLITIISIIISIHSLITNKNDKFAILSILFFCMYYLVINLHVNLILVQTRWFFTYSPLLVFSNLKILELLNLFFAKFNYSNLKK